MLPDFPDCVALRGPAPFCHAGFALAVASAWRSSGDRRRLVYLAITAGDLGSSPRRTACATSSGVSTDAALAGANRVAGEGVL